MDTAVLIADFNEESINLHLKEGFMFVGKSIIKHMDKYILKKQED